MRSIMTVLEQVKLSFDLRKKARTITTLDDAERTLKSHHLVITNGKEPVAIAGVMGGANSEVHAGTTTVVIESAYFAPATVRRTSKEHGLHSDASTRFEKGVDPERVIAAAERAAQLIAELGERGCTRRICHF